MKAVLVFISLVLITIVQTATSQMIYPKDGAVFKVGQAVQTTFSPGQPGETVSLFFQQDRTRNLAGGVIGNAGGTFSFTVPAQAMNIAGEYSQLIAVHRINGHLNSVDNANIKIVK